MKQCLIKVLDEVNIKIEGLDLDIRKALVKKFKYMNPAARYLPAVRLGRWDGCIQFFQLGGSSYVNLLPEIIPVLDADGYDIELEDRRTYGTTFEFALMAEDTFSDRTWPAGHERAGQSVVLRDYQIEIINEFLRNPQSLQEIATGAGKTLITAALSWQAGNYGRSIVIVPNKSLVTQTETDYRNLGLDVGVYFGDRKEWGRQVHMAKADALKTLLTGVMSHIPIRWGLTGTIPKEDFEFQSLHVSLGPVVGRLKAHELQAQGVLAQCHVNIVQLQDHAEYNDYQSELKYLVTNVDRLEYISKIIDKIKDSGNTLILVDRIETGKLLQTYLSTLFGLLGDKPEAVFVSGSTKASDRKDEYDEIATSTNKVIIATYGVAAVGINIPRIFNLVMVESGKSFTRVIQSIGRGIRKAEDKDFVQIWDITSTCKFAKRHLTKRKAFYKDANYPFTVEKMEWK